MMRTRKGYPVYPLTAAQKFHLFYQKFCPKKEVLNIGTSLTIEVDLDFKLLKECIYKAYERCDSMRLRFAHDKEGTYYQYVVDKEERDIQLVDFSGGTMEEAEKTMREWTSVPFKRDDSPMNRIVMIKMPEGYNGIYFLADHMTMDAQSEPVFNGIDGTRLLDETRARYNNPEERAVIDVSDSVDSALDIFHLEEEPTKRLMDFCEKYHISLACLPLMGFPGISVRRLWDSLYQTVKQKLLTKNYGYEEAV